MSRITFEGITSTAFIGGVATEGDGQVATARRMRAAVLFVTGFAMAFTLMGLGASVFGGALLHHRQTLTRIAGAFVIFMGLVTMGILRIPILQRELRPGLARPRPGMRGALPLGVAFAIGWTPCIGPVLAAILTAAAASDGALRSRSCCSPGVSQGQTERSRGSAGTVARSNGSEADSSS